MMRARIISTVVLMTMVIVVGSHFVATSNRHTVMAASSLPDTSNNIHIGLPFNYNTTSTAMNGTVDYVFGSQYPGQPASVYHTLYIPYDRDENSLYYSQAHDITWWKANHLDWIEYKCDRTTVAYEFGTTTSVPLDITNPAVRQYFEQTYVAPALTGNLPDFPGKKFDGIAFDNPAFRNAGGWTGQRCGHYDASGNWVQQFSGTSDDPTYRQAIIAWAQSMQSWMHTNFPSATMSVNFSFDSSYPTDSNTLLGYIDADIDEQGFTNGNNGPPFYFSDGQWLAKMESFNNYLQSGHGFFSINQEPVSFANLTNSQVQWAMANYLLIKNNASYVYVTGQQQYGYLFLRPEYSAQIGSATNAMYQSQNVYMRDFTNGKAIVNPSSSQSYTIALLQNAYKDLYGNAVNSLTLGPVSGIVLLGSNNTTAPTAPTTPLVPTPTTVPATPVDTPVAPTATPANSPATVTATPANTSAPATTTPAITSAPATTTPAITSASATTMPAIMSASATAMPANTLASASATAIPANTSAPATAMPQAAQAVTSFTLVNADTGQDIGPLVDGQTLNLVTLPTRNLNIRADTSPSTVGSVVFGYDANPTYHTENHVPYALAGDNNGVDNAWTPAVGSHTLAATLYTASNGTGTAGTPLTISFKVVNSSIEDTFTRPDQIGWGTTTNADSAPNVAWGMNGDGSQSFVTVSNNTGSYSYPGRANLVGIASSGSTTYNGGDSLVKMAVNAVGHVTPYVVQNACSDKSCYYGARLHTSRNRIEVARRFDGSTAVLASVPFMASANTFYWMRLDVTPGTSDTIQAKVWADGSPEPSSWMVSATDVSPLPANLVGTGGTWDHPGTGESIQYTCYAFTPTGLASPCGP